MTCQNVIIGNPLVSEWELISSNKEDYEKNDSNLTLHTQERFLPKVMVEAGIVSSTSEVRRNKPEFVRWLDQTDCFDLKWGKHHLYIIVGE